MIWRRGRSALEVVRGDLTLQDVDAIVNAANNDLRLGGGVAGAIGRLGGPAIQAECDQIGPIAVGDAAMTTGGSLRARYVIHAASMRFGGHTTADALSHSTRRSLELATARGLRSVAFPAIGTGIAHFPMAECARIMLEEVVAHLDRGGSLDLVRFVLFGEDDAAVFQAEAEQRLG